MDLRSPDQRAVVLTVADAAFLATRLRRLFAHFGIPVPDDKDDARVIGIAGAAIGMLLRNRTPDKAALGVEGES